MVPGENTTYTQEQTTPWVAVTSATQQAIDKLNDSKYACTLHACVMLEILFPWFSISICCSNQYHFKSFSPVS